MRSVLFEVELLKQEVLKAQKEEDELESSSPVHNSSKIEPPKPHADEVAEQRNILLKGQMMFIEDCNAIIFLCSPM